jgi:membrane protein required for colicin V production
MNFLDLILLIVLSWLTFKGWRIGLVRSLVGLVSLVLAYGFSLSYGGTAAARIAGENTEVGAGATLIGFLLVFVITMGICYVAGRILHTVLQATPLGAINAIGGAAFGLAQALLILGLATILIRAYPPHSTLPGYIDNSALVQPVQQSAIALMDVIQMIYPRGSELYNKLVPGGTDTPEFVDDANRKAEEAKAKLDELMQQSRNKLKKQE